MTDDASDPITSPAYDNVVKVSPEAWIAHRAAQKKPTWYLLKLGDQWPRCSLKTTDKRLASAQALKAYQAWLEDPKSDWRAACGNTAHHVGFKTVAEAWLKTQKRDHDYKDGVLRKFLLPFFDQEKQVGSMTMIDQAMIDDYKLWRMSFWLTQAGKEARDTIKVSDKQAGNYREPNANTLNREYPTLRQILTYAAKRGYYGKQAVPDVPAEKASANPRPAFLGDDFNVLMDQASQWIKEAEDKTTRDERQLLADWIWVVRYTGLRVPHEAEKLTWADVRLDVNLLYVPPDTKTGKREVPLRDEAVKQLKDMKKRRKAPLKRELGSEDALFALPNGERCKKLGTLFNALIARCKLPTRADQLPYSPYGLRATFATFSLAEGRSYEWLEEVMGTSTRMLKTHYKQGTIEQTQRYLREKGLLPTNTVPGNGYTPEPTLNDLGKKGDGCAVQMVLVNGQLVQKQPA